MHIATIVSIASAVVGSAAFAWRKQWVMSLAMLFSLAYTVFDKVFPTVLPEQLVTAFSFVFLALTLIFCWQTFSRRRSN
jgi:hypothetical protein